MSYNYNSNVNSCYKRLQLEQQRHKKDELWLGAKSSLIGWAITQGLDTDRFVKDIENAAGCQSGSLSIGRSVVSNDDLDSILFLDNSGSFLEADFEKGTFEHKSERHREVSFRGEGSCPKG